MILLAALAALAPLSGCAATTHPSPSGAPPSGVETEREIARALTHDSRGEFVAAREVLDRALARARAASDRRAEVRLMAERARAAASDAFAKAAGYRDGLALARQAQAAARAASDPRSLAIALDAEGMLHYGRLLWSGGGDFAVPRAAFAAAAAGFRASGDRGGLAEATFHLGLSYEHAHDPATAARHYSEARAIAEQLRDDLLLSYPEFHLAGLARERGDLAAARRGLERTLELRERAAALRLLPYPLIEIADLDLQQGDTAQALARYRRALALAETSASPSMLMWAHLGLADGLRTAGAPAAALDHCERALAFAERAPIPSGIAAAARAAAAIVEAVDPQRARALRDRADRADRAGRVIALE